MPSDPSASAPLEAGNEEYPQQTFDRFLTVSLVAPLLRRLTNPKRPRLPILMYHRIADDPETSVRPHYRLATSPARFASHLALIAERGLRAVSLEQAMVAADRDPGSVHRLVAVTFDDGFADFADAAWPALQRHGFSATVYLPTAFIGTQRSQFRGHPCLTWSEVRDLRRSGVHFGSHTVNHPVLYKASWATITEELFRSRATLEDQLQETIDAFAYPFAYPQFDSGFTRDFEALLRDSGYATSVTTRIGRWRHGSSRLALPRLPVSQADDLELFGARLAGATDWLGAPQHWTKMAKYWLGPGRREGRLDRYSASGEGPRAPGSASPSDG